MPVRLWQTTDKQTNGESVPKTALITRIRGQGGSHPGDLLLKRGSKIHCPIGAASTFNAGRIKHLDADPHEREARFLAKSSRPLGRLTAGHPTEQHHCARVGQPCPLAPRPPQLRGAEVRRRRHGYGHDAPCSRLSA